MTVKGKLCSLSGLVFIIGTLEREQSLCDQPCLLKRFTCTFSMLLEMNLKVDL